MWFSMPYSGEQILSFKSCLVFYAGDSLKSRITLQCYEKYLDKSFDTIVEIKR